MNFGEQNKRTPEKKRRADIFGYKCAKQQGGSSSSTINLQINRDARIRWHEIGDHGTIILQVDNFLANAEELRGFALNLAYSPPQVGDHYPGLSSHVNLSGSLEILNWIFSAVKVHSFSDGNIPNGFSFQGGTPCFFFVKTLEASQVPKDFSDQHTDGSFWLASVLHLSKFNESRGTAFWEHKPTKLQHFSRADPVLSKHLEKFLNLGLSRQLDQAIDNGAQLFQSADVARTIANKRDRVAFSTHDDDDWRLLKYIPSKFNRLVVYPSWQIHSIVDGISGLPLTIANVRLTMNQFLNYPFPRDPVRGQYPKASLREVTGLVRGFDSK